MKKTLIYTSILVGLFTNICSMEEKPNRKRKRKEAESNINDIEDKGLNTSHFLNMPLEVQVHIFEHAIKDVINNNNIFDPYNGVEEVVKNIRLTHSDFNGLKKLLMKFANRYIREHFASEFIGLKPEVKDAELENIFENVYDEEDLALEIEAAKLIITGANPNLKINDEREDNALPLLTIISKTNKFNNLIKLLIKYGARVDEKDNYGYTALMWAAISGNREIVKLLINAGADVNIKSTLQDTALMWAAKVGYEDIDIAKLLINAGAIIDAKNDNGITALIFAVARGYKNITQLLVDKGADVNIKDDSGRTALMYSMIIKRKDIVKLLITLGADVNAQTNYGRTALMEAIALGNSTDVVKLLIKHGADVNAQDNAGNTALIYAVTLNHMDIAELLKKHGCSRII